MKNIIAIIALLLVIVVAWWGYSYFKNDSVNNNEVAVGSYESFTFTDTTTNESVVVSFSDSGNRALFTGLGYVDEVLEQAISASGARYVNADESVVVWNKGNEVTVFIDDEIVFTGITPDDSGVSIINYADLHRYIWVWEDTLVEGEMETKVPNEAGDFEITLSENGMIGVTTDCNNAGGNYTLNNSALTISSDMMRTQMYCEGAMEDDFLGDLMLMTVLEFTSEGKLQLANADSSIIMTFARGNEAPEVAEVAPVVE